MTGVLQHIGLRRRVRVAVPVAIAEARANLAGALAADIVLGGQWQLTRRYWGHLNGAHLLLHGPRANRQFCFLTSGHLQPGEGADTTHIDLEITLGTASETQLLGAAGLLIVMLGGVFWRFGLGLLPLFLAFLYGMTQWHFTHYSVEIRGLLEDLMKGQDQDGARLTRDRA